MEKGKDERGPCVVSGFSQSAFNFLRRETRAPATVRANSARIQLIPISLDFLMKSNELRVTNELRSYHVHGGARRPRAARQNSNSRHAPRCTFLLFSSNPCDTFPLVYHRQIHFYYTRLRWLHTREWMILEKLIVH